MLGQPGKTGKLICKMEVNPKQRPSFYSDWWSFFSNPDFDNPVVCRGLAKNQKVRVIIEGSISVGHVVRDAAAAYRHAIDRGAWVVPSNVEVMELNIPAIHGVGSSRIYFVDRYRDFSIYDVDFVLNPGVDPKPPALTGLHWFGIVQYIGDDRTADWTEFYTRLFGFHVLPDETRYGILPKGRILESPCRRFYLQLIEPMPGIFEAEPNEMFQRVGLGTPDVLATVAALRERGVAFVESQGVHSETRGALTQSLLGGVMFELVHHEA